MDKDIWFISIKQQKLNNPQSYRTDLYCGSNRKKTFMDYNLIM